MDSPEDGDLFGETALTDRSVPVTKRRGPGRPFQKGQSGNPGGMPKGFSEIKELARQHSTDAIATLVKIMKDDAAPHSARVLAAEKILDRGFGKPTQHIEANVNHFDAMGLDELRDYVEREITQIGFGPSAIEVLGGERAAH